MTLNQEQNLAVEHVEGPLLVLAGAGSGKTKVVTHRIAKLIEMGIMPSDILALTFTNRAANEMKKRVQHLVKTSVLTCTFHSLGAKILRETISTLGYRFDFTIYDEEDSEKLLKTCLASLNLKEEKGLAKKIKFQISSAKNNLLSPENVLSDPEADPLLKEIYPIYQQKLKECNALDFDDLLYLTFQLLKENEGVGVEYQNRWLFLLIDEYQDTNLAQYNLTKLLCKKHKNIFAVGDPDQSIYSWRGAKYQNILNFEKDFPGAKVVRLEQNYRSTETILEASNALITHNHLRYEKNLWSNLGKGDKIEIFTGQNEREESYFVMQKIQELVLDKKISLDEIVIFYRTNAQSRIFEDALLSKRLAYQIIGGISFYQRKEVKDILAFLKLVVSSTDLISFSRTINLPKRGLGLTTVKKLIEEASQKNIPILNSLSSTSISLSEKQRQGVQEYLCIIQDLRKKISESHTISDLISDTIQLSSYLDYLKENPESYEERKENLNALIAKASEWQEEGSSLSSFLEELSLKSAKENTSNVPTIKLMTLHNGKGLEFKAVFIVGLEEGILPHINSKDNPENLEEERRLCYVGMTRAKRHLFLCSAYNRFMWGAPRLMQPSRFLKELPFHYLKNNSPTEIQEEESSKPGFSFSKGDRVKHKNFGNGTIQKTYETSYGPTYDIFFESPQITRSLVEKYAHLELIS